MRPPTLQSRRHFSIGLIGLAASSILPLPRPLRAAPLPAPKYPIAREFKAFWDNTAIGTHMFSVSPTGNPGDYDVEVEIDILVDIGLFGEITYRHSSREAWRGGRLVELESRTDDDGEAYSVTGAAAGDYFRMEGPSGPFEAPGGMLTSNSIWSERICEETEIIDATAGTLVGLVASLNGTGFAIASGELQVARIYQLISPIIAGSFWYDEDGVWMKGRLERSGEEFEYVLAS